jgi:hypothetical protein
VFMSVHRRLKVVTLVLVILLTGERPRMQES